MSNKKLKKFQIELKNFSEAPLKDLYHKWLLLSWPQSIALFGATFLFINLIFASLFWLLGPDALTNSSGEFWECFFFSVHTLSTIGYGHFTPQTFTANALVVFEAAAGMITIALLSGLFFGKFSQPLARIRFTNKLLISIHNGKKSLQFRMANHRMNPIIDAKMDLTLIKPENSIEGMKMRKSYSLDLELSHAPMYAMTLTGIHNLEDGPLANYTIDEMINNNFEFIVSIIGTDVTFGQTIHSTHIYNASDIVRSGVWSKIGDIHADGTRVVDLKDFDTIIT